MKQLFNELQTIAETFKDAVPIAYTQLPVIRYSRLNELPSLFGDDETHEWAGFYQIDLYDQTDNDYLKEEIKEMCKRNYWRITNIQDSEEGTSKRYIFDIKIEE
jgi:hypothetical protein